MEQTDPTRMQISTQPFYIIPTQPVLVPPVLYGLHIPCEHKQKRRAVERRLVVRKWKTVFSGHVECWIIENTPAIDPRRYVASRVIAMWINVSLHSFPLRKAGASWNSGRRSGVTVWRRMMRVAVVVRRWSFGGMVV
ncbi:hypothetical protein Hdeb2414_s0006g00209601 [Helianthus debilis subsp. tardiflorus]